MLDHVDDIASDLSAFHRIDDPSQLDGPTYFRLAWRLAAYQGVMQARAIAAREEQQPPSERPFEYSSQPAGRSGINPGTRTTLQAEPAFRGVLSFGTPSDLTEAP
jgi:hypothetical protein